MVDKVIITPYDSEWPILFRRLGTDIRNALGDIALRIDHIGSTSIPGLDAKPIIDIQISVRSLEPVDVYLAQMQALGYVWRSANPDKTKRYFREKPEERRTHIHVRQAGSWPEQFALLFRDYMRTHPEDAGRYADLKYRLAEQYAEDRLDYTEAKAPFIWETMMKADEWSQTTGWQPGPSDT